MIELAKISDTDDILEFVKKNWDRNHIFIKKPELMLWQHLVKKKGYLNFVIAKNKKKSIVGLQGLISKNLSSSNFGNNNLWLALWKIDKNKAEKKALGMELLDFVIEKFKPKSMCSVGINKKVEILFKLMGFKTGMMKQYYIKSNFKSKFSKHINQDFNILKKKKDIINIKKINIDKLFDFNFFDKDKSMKYFKHRFQNHPFYKYFVLEIKNCTNKEKLRIIVREINFSNEKIWRVVDISNSNINKFYNPIFFSKYLFKNKVSYIDFLINDECKEIPLKLGFTLRKENIFLPHHFEPFENKIINVSYCYKIFDKRKLYSVFKSDGDFDRPSII